MSGSQSRVAVASLSDTRSLSDSHQGSPSRPVIGSEPLDFVCSSSHSLPCFRVSPAVFSLLTGDFLHHDWSNSDFVFMNSTCYSPALIASISAQAEKLQPGALVVSLTKALTSTQFKLLSKRKFQMSW